MELNGTLIVQVMHFSCAYIIVDRILLRPAIARIQADERKYAAVEREVSESQERIAARTRYNEQNWHILQKRLRAECPEVAIGQHREMLAEPMVSLPVRSHAEQRTALAALQRVALCAAFTALIALPDQGDS